jgi:hypothetical protein
MAINYQWSFGPLESYPTASGHTDVVFLVHYQMTATTGSDEMGYYESRIINVVPLTLTTGSVFIPYQDLTLEIVQGWVESTLGPQEVEAIYTGLADDINNQINPRTVALPAPWEV